MRLAQSDLDGFLRSINLNGDPTAVRSALLEFFPELIGTYGTTSAVLGADFYDMLRKVPPSSASFRAGSARALNKEQAAGSAAWGLSALFGDTPDLAAMRSRLSGATQRLVMAPFRDTVIDSAAKDPVRTGVARVPSGPTTCKFCVMLASRGAVYYSEASAGSVVGRGKDESSNFNADGSQRVFGNRMAQGVQARGNRAVGANQFHDNCDCATVVIRSRDDFPEGYDPDALLRTYADGSGIGRDIPHDH